MRKAIRDGVRQAVADGKSARDAIKVINDAKHPYAGDAKPNFRHSVKDSLAKGLSARDALKQAFGKK